MPNQLPDASQTTLSCPLDDATREALRTYYNRSQAYLADLERHDQKYLEHYVTFVCAYIPLGSAILDLGCGTGLSARMLSERGFRAVGIDFSRLFLSSGRAQDPAQMLVCADLFELPIASGALDAVAGTNFIEHVTDVPRCLSECWRVLRPGGRLLLAGPNLCSPFFPLVDLVKLLVGRAGRPVFAESWGPALGWLATNTRLTLRKLCSSEPQWLYRRPDLSERHVGGDSDSTYLCCPIDFERYFHRLPGARVLQLSTGSSFKSRLVARTMPRWSPFLGLVVEKRKD